MPDTEDADVEAFAAELRTLRISAGEPSFGQLARRTGYGRSTVHEAFGGHRLPSLDLTLAVVAALGGDCDQWRRAWIASRSGETSSHPAETDQTADALRTASATDPSTRWPWIWAPWVLTLLALLAVGVIGWLVVQDRPDVVAADGSPSTRPSAAAPSCQPAPQYRLEEAGDLLQSDGDRKIGEVRRGDEVALLARRDSVHRFRFLVLVERTQEIGTVDAAKLERAGSTCVAARAS